MTAHVCRLEFINKIVISNVCEDVGRNYLLNKFRQKRYIWNWPVVFFNTSGSRPGFLIKWSNMADLQEEGNTLVDIQRLIICIMVSIIVGRWDTNNLEAKGSGEHVVLFITDIILINSSLVIIVKISSKTVQKGITESIDSNEIGGNELSNNGNSVRIFAILSIKKTHIKCRRKRDWVIIIRQH